jgi:hypothetical protein
MFFCAPASVAGILWGKHMIGTVVRGLALATAVAVVVGVAGMAPANAGGGVSPGAAVGIGLGSFALGTAVGSAANPYYAPGYYPYGYAYPAPGYYPAAPYYPPRNCWDPYYRRYYAC